MYIQLGTSLVIYHLISRMPLQNNVKYTEKNNPVSETQQWSNSVEYIINKKLYELACAFCDLRSLAMF